MSPLAYRSEVILKLVCTPTRGTQCGVQTGEVFVSAHLDEAVHVLCGETNEVKVAFPATHSEVLQLQVNISDTCVSIGHVGGQISANALQALHFLLFFFSSYVLGLKVNQLYQGASDIHSKPWKSWKKKISSFRKGNFDILS